MAAVRLVKNSKFDSVTKSYFEQIKKNPFDVMTTSSHDLISLRSKNVKQKFEILI